MYCHSKGVYYKFMQDADFADIHNTLDNTMKKLSKLSKITCKEKAQPFILSEEDAMWHDGILGQDNPEQLINTLMYLLGVHLSLRAIDKYKALKVGYYSQIKIKYDEEHECKFLQYTELRSKNH